MSKPMKKELRKGDRVRVYFTAGCGEKCTVDEVPNIDCVRLISFEGQVIFAHPNQCRRLKPKKKAPERLERWLVNDCAYQCSTTKEEALKHAAQFDWKDPPKRLVHLKDGEIPVSREALAAAWEVLRARLEMDFSDEGIEEMREKVAVALGFPVSTKGEGNG